MSEIKKKNMSLRMSQHDLDKIQRLATRLGVKESDLMRFAVKQLLTKLAPFQETTFQGTDLMPALLELGEEITDFFELGSEELDLIVNGNLDDTNRRIALDDLRLLALSSANREYAQLKLRGYREDEHITVDEDVSIKEYLREKYFNRAGKVKSAVSSSPDWRNQLGAVTRAIPKSA